MKQLMIQAVKEAGKIIKEDFGKHHRIKSKTPHDFVTEVDIKAEKVILKILNKSGYSILSEESGYIGKNSDYEWIVDPLDGTTNFILGSTLFSTAIGLLYKKEIILSTVFVPMANDLYVAEKGKGAFLNGKRIHVSNIGKLNKSFLIYCHGKSTEAIKKAIRIYSKFKLKCKDMRQFGSASIELTTIASGRAEAFLISGSPKWDTVPGALILKEAGGKLTDFKGDDWNPSKKNLLGSNGKVHREILKKFRKL